MIKISDIYMSNYKPQKHIVRTNLRRFADIILDEKA